MSISKVTKIKAGLKDKVTNISGFLKKQNRGSTQHDLSTPNHLDLSPDLFHPMAAGYRQAYFTNLQQTYGNQYVQRMMNHTGNIPPIQRQVEEEEEEPIQAKMNESIQRQAEEEEEEPIQTKLTIGQPGDKYEQEADQIAESVMRMPDPNVQRQPENEEEELPVKSHAQKQEMEDNKALQAKSMDGNRPIASLDIESRINAMKGSGRPLPDNVRAFMEPLFGADFSHVRIHTGNGSEQANASLNAQAFTHDKNIYFSSGRYNPHSTAGKLLLAHELTHVVQQQQLHSSPIRKPIRSIRNSLVTGVKGFRLYRQPITAIMLKPVNYSVNQLIAPASTTESSTTSIFRPTISIKVYQKKKASKVWSVKVLSINSEGRIKIVPYPATHIPKPVKGGNIVNKPVDGVNGGHYCDVIADLADYTSTGIAGPRWHVTKATIDHENYHWKKEWQVSFNKHWKTAEGKIENLTQPITVSHAKAYAFLLGEAKKIVQKAYEDAHKDYMALPDNAGSKPYRAGQPALNRMITKIKKFAKRQKWHRCP